MFAPKGLFDEEGSTIKGVPVDTQSADSETSVSALSSAPISPVGDEPGSMGSPAISKKARMQQLREAEIAKRNAKKNMGTPRFAVFGVVSVIFDLCLYLVV